MSRFETKLQVFEWGGADGERANLLKRSLRLAEWLDVAYGYDHACGYFLQVKPESADDWVVDLDGLFDGLDGVELLHLFGVLRLPVADRVVMRLMEDLEF
jgi:hypothetical protein